MGERTAAQAQPFALVHAYAANTHHNGSGPTHRVQVAKKLSQEAKPERGTTHSSLICTLLCRQFINNLSRLTNNQLMIACKYSTKLALPKYAALTLQCLGEGNVSRSVYRFRTRQQHLFRQRCTYSLAEESLSILHRLQTQFQACSVCSLVISCSPFITENVPSKHDNFGLR